MSSKKSSSSEKSIPDQGNLVLEPYGVFLGSANPLSRWDDELAANAKKILASKQKDKK